MKNILLIALLMPLFGYTQTLSNLEFISVIQLRIPTAQVFVDKFNGKLDFKGEPLKNNIQSTENRLKSIYSCFSSSLIENKREDVSAFVKDCMENNKRINKWDKNWLADVTCEVLYKEKKQKIHVFLQYICKEKESDCEWIIKKIEADFIKKSFEQPPKKTYILPSDDEVNFPTIVSMLDTDKRNAYQYIKSDSHNITDIFLFGVQEGIIKFSYVEKIVFHFLQVDGWIFTLDKFYASEKNLQSGYLINNVFKAYPIQKETYLKKMGLEYE